MGGDIVDGRFGGDCSSLWWSDPDTASFGIDDSSIANRASAAEFARVVMTGVLCVEQMSAETGLSTSGGAKFAGFVRGRGVAAEFERE